MEAQPQQQLTEQQKSEKEFADLLSSLMDCVEKYQEGEAGEGNYLVAMNCLRDIHKFKDKLKGNVVYHHYEQVARAPARPPTRPPAQRKKHTDDQKRANGYKTCPTCGCLFADNSKLKRHMDTTEKCRHIRIEKEVALNTKQIYRDQVYRPVCPQGLSVLGRGEIPKPEECLHKEHPYRPQFITEFLLCFSHRETYIAKWGAEGSPMSSPVCMLRPDFQGSNNTDVAPTAGTHLMWNPSASFLRRDPANAIVSLSNFLTPPSIRHLIGWVECNEAERKWSFKVEAHQYSRSLKKSTCVQALRFNFITDPLLDFLPLTERDLYRVSTKNRGSGSRVVPTYEFFVDFDYYAPWVEELWVEEMGLGEENWNMIIRDA
jgi:hypothetical protein